MLAHQSEGIKRLGVLMMDVDGLGGIFRDGLGKRATLSRIAHLSFAINLFFEGWVAEMARKVDDRERLYSIYAGGDDLFFVGAWDAVIALAQQVRADLGEYAGGHPGIHASGAIVLIGGKYPLYRAAQDLKEAEDKAKTLEWKSDDGKPRRKDALCFLGQALPWSRVGYGAAPATDSAAGSVKELLLKVAEETRNKGLNSQAGTTVCAVCRGERAPTKGWPAQATLWVMALSRSLYFCASGTKRTRQGPRRRPANADWRRL